MKVRNFIQSFDFDAAEMKTILELARKIKASPLGYRDYLHGRVAALIFEKPSTRTRVSFEAGYVSMGGHVIYLGPNDVKLGVREDIADMARSLSRYIDVAILRTFSHRAILEFARHFGKPVVNGLSDMEHPCQALSDFFTIQESLGGIKGKKIAYVGDGNNVCHSLLLTAARLGAQVVYATPKAHAPNPKIMQVVRHEAKRTGAKIQGFTSPAPAVRGADILYTDVWVSMGEESKAASKKEQFKDFQVNQALVRKAKKTVKIMHCLPAHRGEEITNEVLEGSNSIVFDQAENRLHVQKAILIYLSGSNVGRLHGVRSGT